MTTAPADPPPTDHRARQGRRRAWLEEASAPGRHWIRAATGLLLLDAAAGAGFAAALGGAVQTATDALQIPGQPLAQGRLAGWIVLGLVCAVSRGIAGREGELCGNRASIEVRVRLRARLSRALLARTDRRPDDAATLGTTITALAGGVDSLDGYVSRLLPARKAAVPAQMLVLLATALGSWVSALLLLGTLLPFALIMALAGGAAADEARQQFDALARLSGLFADRIRKLPLILAARAERRQAALLGRASADLHRRTMRVLRLAFLSSAGLEFFAALSVALVAMYCGFSLLGLLPFRSPEPLTLGRAVFVLALAPEFFAPMRRLAAAYHDERAAEAAADRMAPLAEPSPVLAAATHAPLAAPPHLRFEAVSVLYPGCDRPALDGLEMDVRPGEMVALLGASGTGKSSAIKLLLGLAPLAGGEVWIDDAPLSGLGDIAACASWMGQDSFLIPASVSENIALSRRDASLDEIRAAANAAGLEWDGAGAVLLDRQLDERGGGLSGGERRRIALARALLKPSALLLLDEPTAHLDPDTEAALIGTIRAAARGRTTIVATHSAALAASADRIVRLHAA
ncbi:thiol reductant ABC exporter subunit CydD [Acetobacteraceae bacterium KSS8]|uniref:Thiol reductant ABC exporter subunit CydD n=1 Tax=Endosaccharibacter trunci TaxID=2812733 RepID=A0ABT1WAK7_9PROT|nr:thiol reductant ABC exporter subunit CydD [Acetobacteraceae bacterium KSS8]